MPVHPKHFSFQQVMEGFQQVVEGLVAPRHRTVQELKISSNTSRFVVFARLNYRAKSHVG